MADRPGIISGWLETTKKKQMEERLDFSGFILWGRTNVGIEFATNFSFSWKAFMWTLQNRLPQPLETS
jgi:hypothetical protein